MFLILLMALQTFAATDIVPIGVRALVYQHINAEVKGSYGPNGVEKPYNVEEVLKVTSIAEADPKAKEIVTKIRKQDAELVDSLDLGSIDMKPDIRVKVDVFGMAFGVSKNFMIVGVVPVYSAKTRIGGTGFNTTESFNRAEEKLRQKAIQDPSSKVEYNALADFLSDVAPPNGENAQAILTNEFGYKPLGHWEGQGIGDLMFFGQIKTIDRAVYKQAWKVGAEAPTGRTDDPDNLVDVPFGKGHFVSFAESLNDFYVFKDNWILAANFKYAYNWGHNPTYRLAPDSSIPLTKEKEQVYRKPGDVMQANLHSEVKLMSDLYLHTDYFYQKRGRDSFRGSKDEYDYGILERRTDQTSHTGEVGLSYTTANLYQRNKFPIPFKIGTFFSRLYGGTNVDKVDMAIVRFEGYF